MDGLLSSDEVPTLATNSTVQSPSAGGSESTPDTEVSLRDTPPDATKETYFPLPNELKAKAVEKAASLSLTEQVSQEAD